MQNSTGCQIECLNGGTCVAMNFSFHQASRTTSTYECLCPKMWQGSRCEKFTEIPVVILEECHNQMRTLLLVFLMVNVVLLFLCFIIIITYACNRKHFPPVPTPEKLANILYKRLKDSQKT